RAKGGAGAKPGISGASNGARRLRHGAGHRADGYGAADADACIFWRADYKIGPQKKAPAAKPRGLSFAAYLQATSDRVALSTWAAARLMPRTEARSSMLASRMPSSEPNFTSSARRRLGPMPGMASSCEARPILPRRMR